MNRYLIMIPVALNNETLLYNALFKTGYNPRLRPRRDVSQPVVVTVEYELNAVADVVGSRKLK